MGLTKPRAAQIYNLDYKQATRVAATTNVTLSGGAPASVDGVSLNLNDRVLVTGQNTGSQNGIYYVTTVGSGSNGTWTRTTDADNTGEIEAGMIVMVTEGTVYADTQWKLITNDPITIGSTALTFTQNYSANSISGGTSNVTVYSNANVTISSAGTPNVLIVSSTGTIVTGTESVTGNITGGNVLTGGLISAAGNITGNYVLGNVFFASGITASKIYNGTSEANVGTSGGNANISIGGTSNVVVFASTGEYVTGLLSVTGNITGGNIAAIDDGNYSAYLSLQTKTPGSTGTNGLVERVKVDSTGASVVANITGGNILTGGLVSASGTITGTSHIGSVVSVTGAVTGASLVGTITTASQTNITAVGTLGSLSVSGNTISGNILTAGLISAAGNITGANLISATTFSATGNTISGNILTGGVISATGDITGSSVLVTGAFNSAYTDGTVMDYVTGNGRLTVGSADGFTIYNGGTSARTSLLALNASGALGVGTSPSYGTSGQVLTSAGSGAPPTWAASGVGTITTTDFTATSGQTVFTVTYTVGLVSVYRNGIKLGAADYTATNGTSITLATGAITGDLIEVQAFSSLNLTTAVSSFSAGTTGLTPSSATTGAVVLAGTLNVANGGTGVTTSTGSGNNVLSTSPTLVTPALGGSTSGAVTLAVPAVAGTNTITFPASTGTVLTSGSPQSGGVIQVVNSNFTTIQSTTSSSPVSTTLTASITPKFSTSKIYISVSSVGGQSSSGRSSRFYIYRGATQLTTTECNDNSGLLYFPICMTWLDSPATTSSTTYTIYFATDGVGTNYFGQANSPSVITLMEIAA